MDAKAERATAIQASIRQVLNERWDPLAVYVAGPADEYDSIIGPVYRLLCADASLAEIVALLQEFERDLGAITTSRERLNAIAQKLKGLDIRLQE